MSKRFELYQKYLKSNDWDKKRQHIAKIRNYVCEKCKKIVKHGFHIHHKTYKHFGNELDNELMFLCEECHNKLHFQKSINKIKQKAYKKKSIKCKNCLEKIPYLKYMKDFITHCPFCGFYIGRPNKYGKTKRR